MSWLIGASAVILALVLCINVGEYLYEKQNGAGAAR
jgi:hypothetical protein